MGDYYEAGRPTQSRRAVGDVTEPIRAPDELPLLDAAEYIAQQLVYGPGVRGGLTSKDDDQALKVLRKLQGITPPLTAKGLGKILHVLSKREAILDELYRVSRYAGLAEYLIGLGAPRDRIIDKWEFDSADAVLLISGVGAGVLAELGATLRDIALIAIVTAAIGVVGGPVVAGLFAFIAASAIDWPMLRRAFSAAKSAFAAAREFLRKVAPMQFLRDKHDEVERLLVDRKYYEAGKRVGEMGVQVAFTVIALKDLAVLIARLAPRLTRMTRQMALRFRIAELEFRIRTGGITEGSAAGWDFVKLPHNRLLLRRAELGAVEVEEAQLREWAAIERSPPSLASVQPTPPARPLPTNGLAPGPSNIERGLQSSEGTGPVANSDRATSGRGAVTNDAVIARALALQRVEILDRFRAVFEAAKARLDVAVTANDRAALNILGATQNEIEVIVSRRVGRGDSYATAYGRTLERIVSRDVATDPTLRTALDYTAQEVTMIREVRDASGKVVRIKGKPDFTGRPGSAVEGLNLDITTFADTGPHLNPEVRFYGENLIVYGYRRPN